MKDEIKGMAVTAKCFRPLMKKGKLYLSSGKETKEMYNGIMAHLTRE